MNDITSCIAIAEENEKLDIDSPLKEPLKKKGANIHNPYPNFKVNSEKSILKIKFPNFEAGSFFLALSRGIFYMHILYINLFS